MRALVLRLLPRSSVPLVENVIPLRMLPSQQAVFGILPWAGVAGLGALWLVQVRSCMFQLLSNRLRPASQPWGFLKSLVTGPPPEQKH